MKVNIEIEIEDAYSELRGRDKEEFIDSNIGDASDDALIDEFKRRGLAEDLM